VETGTAIAIGVGAVVVVFLLTRHQEQKTAAMITAQQPQKSSGPYALSINDQIAIGGSILATYFGGPATGAKVAGVLAS
jgi:hypothetical protein